MAQTRLELFLTELEEEKNRLLKLLALGATAILMLAAGLVFLAIFITVLLWDEHRLLALGLCSLFFLGGGTAALFLARAQAVRKTPPLAASLNELAEDRSALQTPPQP
ncbi:MAG: hypothetical protein EKK46_04110 [Rhodocyclaceae bacterium]|nr:MAG: hypothetical protein EKK46_04110 [Rhodocyclaceae bacterium]